MTGERARPWWATPGPGVDELADEEDPVTSHRRARHGHREDAASASGPHDRADAGGAAGDGPRADEASQGGPTHDPATCGVCPICLGLRAIGEHHPEVIEHLTEASRHLAAAVRGLLDPRPVPHPGAATSNRASDGADDPHSSAAGNDFERIEVQGPEGRGSTERGT